MNPREWLAHCAELCRHSQPLTPEELAEQQSLRAAEMARAEARREQPSPQMELNT